ncbi:MAG: hypothetical protein K0A89_09010 [ANME-2 cluster archaeon]|nr:hypothetical protein [ANME-2 cluster archaeon]
MKIENATIADAKQILGLQKLAYINEAEIYCIRDRLRDFIKLKAVSSRPYGNLYAY